MTPREAKRMVHGGAEVAFLDVREHGQFGEGHPLFCVSCPYSRLETRVQGLVPSTRVPVLLLDDGDGIAERAARRLQALGYADLRIVAGGAPAWEAAGFALYKGVNVPSKLLGELAEHVWQPLTVTATELAAWQSEGRAFRLFDTRPAAEYRKMSIPGARWLPNGELAHRLDAVAPGEETLVLNCAGRTRGLIGAVGLHVAGVSHPVYALENGTQGWALAGLTLDHGRIPEPLPVLDAPAVDASRRRARRLAEMHDIPWIDAEALAGFAADAGRTLYLLDVRTDEEFDAGHWPGAVHAPGVQLVQATDQWVAIRHARLALFDDTGLRGTLAAFWLRQLGYEPHVVPYEAASRAPFPGIAVTAPRGPDAHIGEIGVLAAYAAMQAGKALLLDLRSSQEHRRERPVGARWAIRPRLEAALDGWNGPTYLVAEDAVTAAIAAIDLRELGVADVRLVAGGLDAWRRSGLPVGSGAKPADGDAIDYLWFVHDRHDGNLDAARRYLAWEQGLIAQLDAEEKAEFDLVTPA
jgi:rhodanese-related sulfurtransferase